MLMKIPHYLCQMTLTLVVALTFTDLYKSMPFFFLGFLAENFKYITSQGLYFMDTSLHNLLLPFFGIGGQNKAIIAIFSSQGQKIAHF